MHPLIKTILILTAVLSVPVVIFFIVYVIVYIYLFFDRKIITGIILTELILTNILISLFMWLWLHKNKKYFND